MLKGGGAGKVYFVLYLAVVLELLIIIVERDEAEEGLHKKQKETMKIVESILSQLQSGSGTEGINTRPQDEITIPPAGVNLKEVMGTDIKSYRKYIVEVGVTDISAAVKKKEGEPAKEYQERLKKLVQLANVEELEYQIFYNDSEDPSNAPDFPSAKYFKENDMNFSEEAPEKSFVTETGETWTFKGLRKLKLDKDATFNSIEQNDGQQITADKFVPVYPKEMETLIGPTFQPKEVEADSVYFFQKETMKEKKRSFVVHFQPPNKAGWYKLRFTSRTNRILGVRAEAGTHEISDDATVNIGTVQLKVQDLRKVFKTLASEVEKFDLPRFEVLSQENDVDKFDAGINKALEASLTDDDAVRLRTKINLYGYIAKLLAPGQSVNFDQNKGAIEFNVRVITPQPKLAEPAIFCQKKVYTFEKTPGVFQLEISPYQGTSNVVNGSIYDEDGAKASDLTLTPMDQIAGSGISAPAVGFGRKYRATVSNELTPGKYQIAITHRIGTRAPVEDKNSTLEVFASGLTEVSMKNINSRMSTFAYYGYKLSLEGVSSSAGKIKANQFRTYISTDNNNQPTSYTGLSIASSENIIYTPESKSITMKMIWIQPYTNEEVVLFPSKTFEIRQEEPTLAQNSKSVRVSGTSAKLKISVNGLKVTSPVSGDKSATPSELKVRVGDPEKVTGLGTYNFSIEPSITEVGTGEFMLELEMTGKMPRGKSKASGEIKVPIYMKSINGVNGVESEEVRGQVTIPVTFSPDKRGGRKRRR